MSAWRTSIPVWLLLAVGAVHATSAAPSSVRAKVSGDIRLLDAPSNLGLRPPQPGVEPGVNRLPEAIRATGLPERLRVQDMGRVLPPAYSFVDKPTTGFRNGLAIAKYSRELATRLSPILSSKRFVVVLGGDCSVLLGTGLALREKGRYGLVFIDAHDDFSPPRESFGYHGRLTAAGRDLGLATGFGPEQLVDIAGRKPYFRIDDVVQIGLSRTAKDGEFFAIEQFDHSGASVFDIDAIRRHGVHEIARKARHRLESAGTDGFWIHLDADVLDATVMPAVDSPNPRGMSLDQLQVILAELLASPKAVGMELTIFDPSLDPDGRLARQLANVIERAFVLSGRVRGFAATEDAMVHIPRNEAIFADALLAREPAPKVAGDNDIFAPLLGSWNLDVVFYNPDGSIKKRIPGEWHFARVLEGRAIADVWVVPPRADRKTIDPPPGEYGATLRFYDPHIHAWRSVWHGVVNGIVWSFIGRRIDDEIVLERIDEDGKLSHWVFYDMRADTFKWRSEVSSDGGKTWRLQQVMWAKRQPVGAT